MSNVKKFDDTNQSNIGNKSEKTCSMTNGSTMDSSKQSKIGDKTIGKLLI